MGLAPTIDTADETLPNPQPVSAPNPSGPDIADLYSLKAARHLTPFAAPIPPANGIAHWN
jgi:hypothetical protein